MDNTQEKITNPCNDLQNGGIVVIEDADENGLSWLEIKQKVISQACKGLFLTFMVLGLGGIACLLYAMTAHWNGIMAYVSEMSFYDISYDQAIKLAGGEISLDTELFLVRYGRILGGTIVLISTLWMCVSLRWLYLVCTRILLRKAMPLTILAKEEFCWIGKHIKKIVKLVLATVVIYIVWNVLDTL